MSLLGKQFGLIKRTSKKVSVFVKKPSIFGDDSDEEPAHEAVNQSLMQEATKSNVKKQTKIEIQKALEEDPTVYEYDSIYDEMEKKKQEMILQKKADKERKPKYIEGLMKAAKVRNREKEKIMERKIQKEREEEGDIGETDAFVTSAYKKKLEEMKKEEEKEKREAEREAKLDVTKQKDLSGFYRYLYRETNVDAATKQVTKSESQDEKNVLVETERFIIEEKDSIAKETRTKKKHNSSSAEIDKSKHDYKIKSSHKEDYYRNQRSNQMDEHIDLKKRSNSKHNAKKREERDSMSSRDDRCYIQQSSEIDELHCKDKKYDYEKDFHKEKSRSKESKTNHDNDESNYKRMQGINHKIGDDYQEISNGKKTEKRKNVQEESKVPCKYSKRNVGESVRSAKERYLARQMARVVSQVTAPIEEDE
ncbi:uncharacterized protein [Antedon mediterranea]|uniref:uncharacterized protein n=1 Tax=Antedon mediterranea TaxID=105859 RepID=UPI003AF957BE